MPTYEYRCESCGRTVEVVQRFTDAPLTICESCNGVLRKVYAPVGIVFKGSGFYKNDSRSTSKSASRTGESSTESGSGATKEGTSGTSGTSGGAESNGASKEPAPAASASPAPATPAAPASSSD